MEARREVLEGCHTCVQCKVQGIGPSQFVVVVVAADEHEMWCRVCYDKMHEPTKPKVEAWDSRLQIGTARRQ